MGSNTQAQYVDVSIKPVRKVNTINPFSRADSNLFAELGLYNPILIKLYFKPTQNTYQTKIIK